LDLWFLGLDPWSTSSWLSVSWCVVTGDWLVTQLCKDFTLGRLIDPSSQICDLMGRRNFVYKWSILQNFSWFLSSLRNIITAHPTHHDTFWPVWRQLGSIYCLIERNQRQSSSQIVFRYKMIRDIGCWWTLSISMFFRITGIGEWIVSLLRGDIFPWKCFLIQNIPQNLILSSI